jgi:hypothetical protein
MKMSDAVEAAGVPVWSRAENDVDCILHFNSIEMTQYANLHAQVLDNVPGPRHVTFTGFEDAYDARMFAEACLQLRLRMKGEVLASEGDFEAVMNQAGRKVVDEVDTPPTIVSEDASPE